MRNALLVGVLCLAAVALTQGCTREPYELPSELEGIVEGPVYSALQFSDWSEPVNLGPTVNTASVENDVAISRDGLSLYFGSNRPGSIAGSFDIWVSQRASVDDPWGAPQNLGPIINTAAREQGPFVTLDGHRLFFFSDRAGGLGGNDLYVARRRDVRDDLGWQAPENLGGGVNSAFNEGLPVHFEDDATGEIMLYFNSNRPAGVPGTGRTDIYASTLQPDETFGPAVLVPELSSPGRDARPTIERDGLELILSSDREGTLGSFDLWLATRASTSDPWSLPVNLGLPVTTAAGEARAALSFDGMTLYIVSSRPDGGFGAADLWVSTRSRLTGPSGDQ